MLSVHLSTKAKFFLATIFVVLVIVGLVTFHIRGEEQNSEIEAGRDINQLTLEDGASPFRDVYGRPYTVPSHEDGILILTTWASWCASCEEDLKRFEEIAAEYDQAVQILAVNRKEPEIMVRSYVKRFSDFKHVTLVLDERDHFFNTVDGTTIPETVFYDYEGEVHEHVRQPLSTVEIRNIIGEIQEQ